MAYQVYLSDDIDIAELDTENIDISAVFELLDITDISNKNSDLKQISFKGTKNNNNVFGSFFDLGRSSDFDLQNKLYFNYNPLRVVTCLVYQEANLIFKGSLRLYDITIDRNGGLVYQTILTAALIDMKTALQDKYLADLDFTDLKHRYVISAITNSWNVSTERYSSTSGYTSAPFAYGSGYVYPNIDYGHFTGSTDVNNINFKNFKPAIYAKEYLDRIFNQPVLSGYTYEIKADADFKEMFNHLIIPDTQEKLVYVTSGITSTYSKPFPMPFINSFPNGPSPDEARKLVPISIINHPNPLVCGHLMELTIPYTDVLSVKRNFKTSAKLEVDFNVKLVSVAGPIFGESQVRISLVRRNPAEANNSINSNWTEIDGQTFDITASTSGYNINLVKQLALTEFIEDEQIGVRVEVMGTHWFLNIVGGPGPGQGSGGIFVNLPQKKLTYNIINCRLTLPADTSETIQFDINPSTSANPDVVVPTAPVNIKQIDFLKSMMNQFNFMVYSPIDNQKKLIFEKYDDYYVLAQARYLVNNSLDWTNKAEYTDLWKMKTNIALPKSYLFTHKTDVDYLTDTYQKKFNKVYGSFSFNDEYGLVAQKKNELIFSPTIITTESGTDRKYPLLYKLDGGNKKVTKTNIRLAYYNGLQFCTPYTIGIYSAGTMNTVYTGSTNGFVYPQISNYYLVSGSPVNDIHFNRPDEVYFPFDLAAINAPNSYFNYYVNEVTDLTNPDVVYIEGYAMLNDIDIANLDLKVPIYINSGRFNNSYFKLLKVEYNGADSPSKIQLQKIPF